MITYMLQLKFERVKHFEKHKDNIQKERLGIKAGIESKYEKPS